MTLPDVFKSLVSTWEVYLTVQTHILKRHLYVMEHE